MVEGSEASAISMRAGKATAKIIAWASSIPMLKESQAVTN